MVSLMRLRQSIGFAARTALRRATASASTPAFTRARVTSTSTSCQARAIGGLPFCYSQGALDHLSPSPASGVLRCDRLRPLETSLTLMRLSGGEKLFYADANCQAKILPV